MNTAEFIAHLLSHDILLSVDGDRLRINAPKGALTDELRASLAQRKPELLAFLRQSRIAPAGADRFITPADRTQRLPLSFNQQRLWFLDQMMPASPAYSVPFLLVVEGQVDAHSLERALNEIVRRHESLRTVFAVDESGAPYQKISPQKPFELPVVRLEAGLRVQIPTSGAVIAPQDLDPGLMRFVEQQARVPFDLSAGPLYRFCLVRQGVDNSLFVNVHHAVFDGWSVGVLLLELMALYEAFVAGKLSPLPALPVQYGDYAAWQRRTLTPQALQADVDYWKEALAGPLPVIELPGNRPRPALQAYGGALLMESFPAALTPPLKALAAAHESTLFMTLLAAFQCLIYRYTGQPDVIVGTPIAGRYERDVEGLIGFFVNTLPLRASLAGNPTYVELLGRVRSAALGAFGHQEPPFELLVDAMHLPRDVSHSPIFQVLFALQNTMPNAARFEGAKAGLIFVDSGTSKFDLTLNVYESPDGLVCGVEYNTGLFERATIERMLGHYRTLLEAICTDPQQRIEALPLLTDAERRLLAEWNATEQPFPQQQTLSALFEAQADRTPEAIAVCDERAELTYAELEARSNRLAAYLRSMGAGPEVCVGISLPRSLDMLVALLAVGKCGAAYVPLDPNFPAERLAYMLADSGAPLLVTESSLTARYSASGLQMVCVDRDAALIAACSAARTACPATPDSLAYLIYTSGSTGKPKGVQVLQRGLVNFLASMQRAPGLAADDVLMSVTTLSFDIAGLELYLPIICGARLVIIPAETAADGDRLRHALEIHNATVMQATPATWRLLLAAGWPGAPGFKALCGGEALPAELAEGLLARCGSLWNLYGPTETTIWSTLEQVLPDRAITIGRPIANTQIYILDVNGQHSPIGVPGELVIGGAGVARGYHDRPELTVEKFIPDTFSGKPGMRLYRTGDLARRLPDGRIEFLGRIDQQVKLRGFRIELGEIEFVLAQHPAVRQAVVMARDDPPGEKRLVAYLILEPDCDTPTVSELRSFLAAQLPDYMLPAVFTFLETLPLTPNGKVDRRSLPAPDAARPELVSRFTPPASDVERTLAEIWQAGLQLERVGVDDNFFELGGHSLLVVRIHQEIVRRFQTDLTIAQMFQYPTIRSLAQRLSRPAVSSAATSQAVLDRAALARQAQARGRK